MPIEIWGSDEAGHLMLLPDPTPERTPGTPDPPAGEPPLPGAEAPPAVDAASTPMVEAVPADELRAIRRLIEEQRAEGARRDVQLDTMTRVLGGQTPALPETPAAPAGPPPRPSAEAFASQDEYVEAVADWKAEEKVTAFERRQEQARQTAAQQQALLTRDQVVRQEEEAFVTAHPDYVEVVQRGLVAKTPQAFRQLIMLTEDAPAVAYAIAQDEALLGRLMQMPPQQLFYALGRLSGEYGRTPGAPAETAPPPGGPTAGPGQAPQSGGRPKPTPPRPLSGTGVAPVSGYREDMSMPEYRLWKKQNAM